VTRFITGIIVALGLLTVAAGPTAARMTGGTATASYIVVLSSAPDAVPLVAADHAQKLGLTVRFVYRSALVGYAADVPDRAVEALRADPRVVAVVPDRDTYAAGQEQQLPGGQGKDIPLGIDRVDADLSPTADIDGVDAPRVDVDVAVLDTGIDVDHPDLNVAGGKDCQGGRDFSDPNGHGTHISGVVGALDDGVGVVGVAPGVRLWAVRVLDEDRKAGTKEVLCGIDWVTATRLDDDPRNDIEVVNFSLNTPGRDDGHCGAVNNSLLHRAICRSVGAGVTYVVSAGNESKNAARFVPAAYDEVITVSALADSDGRPGSVGGAPACQDDVDDTLADFSNTGRDVDLIAPGVCVLSTEPVAGPILPVPDTDLPSSDLPSTELVRIDGPGLPAREIPKGYGLRSGTSFSAPHVTGAAALYLSRHPGAPPAQVRSVLMTQGNGGWDAHEDTDRIKEPVVDARAL
jgi:subtilisin